MFRTFSLSLLARAGKSRSFSSPPNTRTAKAWSRFSSIREQREPNISKSKWFGLAIAMEIPMSARNSKTARRAFNSK